MDDVNASIQASHSIENRGASGISEASGRRDENLREGDSIAGIIDITDERTHPVPANRSKDHAGEKEELVHIYIHLAKNLS